jgi:predicted DNA-binding protein (MmcQ/YjbR family)
MGGKMNRQKLAAYITDTYGVNGAHLFARYPNFQVFRHNGNKKWFAVLMDIPKKNLGLTDDGEISVVNLKCDTRLIGSFRMEPGIFPGWHMNKAHWLTVELDGTVEDEKIKFLVDMSYELMKK